MKVAVLCPGFARVGGGSVLYARRVAEELARLGHETVIVTDDQAGAGAPAATGVPLVRLPRDPARELSATRRLRIETRRGGYRIGRWLFRSGRTRLLAAGPVCPALEQPDGLPACDVAVLVNASTAWTVHLLGRIQRRLGPPLVVVPLLHTRDAWAARPGVLRLLDRCAGVIGLTAHEGRFLREQGASSARFAAIPAGSDASPAPADAAAFRGGHGIPAAAPVVLFLGRKVLGKGVVHVVQAMDRVWDEFPDARLVLAGFSHNGRAWLEGYLRISRHPALERTVDLDDVSEGERESALAACTFMAAPSINDSFGIVYLDAWRHSKPVIACSDAPAAEFIGDRVHGRLVPFGKVNALAEAMLGLLRHPDETARMGAAGHQHWCGNFQWDAIAARVARFISECAEPRPVGTGDAGRARPGPARGEKA